jgi:hypothetical protein
VQVIGFQVIKIWSCLTESVWNRKQNRVDSIDLWLVQLSQIMSFAPDPIQYLSLSAEKQLKYHASQLGAPICVSDMWKRAICLNPKKQDIIEPKINFYKDWKHTFTKSHTWHTSKGRARENTGRRKSPQDMACHISYSNRRHWDVKLLHHSTHCWLMNCTLNCNDIIIDLGNLIKYWPVAIAGLLGCGTSHKSPQKMEALNPTRSPWKIGAGKWVM